MKPYTTEDIAYIERTVKCLVTNLKQAGVLAPEFSFSTKVEREKITRGRTGKGDCK